MRKPTNSLHIVLWALFVAVFPNFAYGAEGEPIHSDRVREVTGQVLSMRQFRYEKSALREWFDQVILSRLESVVETVKSYLQNVYDWFAVRPGMNLESPALSKVAVVIAFLLLAGILLASIIFVFKKVHSAAQNLDTKENTTRTGFFTSEQAIAAASAAVQRCDYLEAFRMVYLAVLLSLDKAGIIRYERSRTNWEYVRALQDAGHQSLTVFAELTTTFDHRIYGGSKVSARDYETWLAKCKRLVESIENGVR